jgi:ribosomal-protein-alanine N-acetyltransferase
MDENWVEVRNCNWLHQAYFVKSVLEGDGIEVLIPDEHLLGVQPLYANAVGGARVLVRAADLERAAEILRSVEEPSSEEEPSGEDDERLTRRTAPERIETARLLLRRPSLGDAESIFSRYASDPEVTRYLSWPTHRSIEDTRRFLELSESEWQKWHAGPYLIESRDDGRLVGSTGFGFETPLRAATGYVLARDAWGRGYATEALLAILALAPDVGIRRLHALCHPEHFASQRVLEKCGFDREGLLQCHSEFPNLRPGEPCDVLCYVRGLRVGQ